MQVFTVGFFFRISDPRFGGTYMSLLVTITSVGWSISKTLSLQMVDVLTFGKCSNDYQNDCSTIGLEQVRKSCLKSCMCCIHCIRILFKGVCGGL